MEIAEEVGQKWQKTQKTSCGLWMLMAPKFYIVHINLRTSFMKKRLGNRKLNEKYCFSVAHILTKADINPATGGLLDLVASLSFSY